MSSEIITVKVGPHAKEYRVHQTLLIHYSEYFRGAFRSGMEESRTRIFNLKDIELHTFDAFVDWLYVQKLPHHHDWGHRYPGHEQEWEDVRLVSLYAFAERFVVPGLKISVMEVLVGCFNEYELPNSTAIIIAFEHLPVGSPVHRLLVDVYCRSGHAALEADGTPFEELPNSFVRRAMETYATMVKRDSSLLKAEDYQEETESVGKAEQQVPPQKKQKTNA